MKRFISRGVFVAAALLLLTVSARAETPGRTVIHTQWKIQALAMNGPQVAYDVSGAFSQPQPKGCVNKVFAWNLHTRTTRRVSGEKTCDADGTSTGAGVRELAVAGKRFAWIVNQGGNTYSDDYLRTASLPHPKERQLAAAARGGEGIGNWIGGLVASGDLLAVNRWSTDATGTATRSELDLVGANGLRRLVSGPNAIFVESADSGRLAVLRTDGSVGIYAASGRLLLEVKPSSPKEIALRGNDLLVLTNTRTLEIYDSRSGAHLRSWPVPRGAATLDAYGGVAVYADLPTYSGQRFKVHVLRVKTGRDAVVGTGTDEGPRRVVQIEAPGLVYAKNPHTLVFIALEPLLAAVS